MGGGKLGKVFWIAYKRAKASDGMKQGKGLYVALSTRNKQKSNSFLGGRVKF
jgi:hypothetical protein